MFNHYAGCWLWLLLWFGLTNAFAQDIQTELNSRTNPIGLTKAVLDAKINALNAQQGLDESSKAPILALYAATQENLNNSESVQSQREGFADAYIQAPLKIKQLLALIEQTQSNQAKHASEMLSKRPAEGLEQLLANEKETLSQLVEQIKIQETEQASQQARLPAIREESLAAKQAIESIQQQQRVASELTGSALAIEAKRMLWQSLLDYRSAQLTMLMAEAKSNPIRVELLKTALHLLDMQKNAQMKRVALLDAQLSAQRQQDAQQIQTAISLAEKALSGKHPLIQALTRENIEYSRVLQDLSNNNDRYNAQRSLVEAKASDIDRDFKSAEKKITLAGLSPALGNILREQRRGLLALVQFDLQADAVQNETALTSLEQFKIEEKLKQFTDTDGVLKALMRQVDLKLPEEQRLTIQAELRVLLDSQQVLLTKLALASTTYLRLLGDFDFARQQMLEQAAKFAAYLDENLLWVKSTDPISASYPAALLQALKWMLSPLNGMVLLADALQVITQNPFLVALGGFGLAFLFWLKQWAKQQLIAISVNIAKVYTDELSDTLQALAYTLLKALPLPLLSYYSGWLLSSHYGVADFSQAMGKGLQSAAFPWLFLQFFYSFFAAEGIARQHFQWQKFNASLLHQQLAWLRFVAVLTIFVIRTTGLSKVALYSDSLGRLALILSMVAMALFSGRLLNPNKGLLQFNLTSHVEDWIIKLRHLWYLVVIAIPLVIIGFAAAGYYLSALELQEKLVNSLRLIFIMILVHELVIRWLILVNRQLAVTNARQKRKTAVNNEKHLAGSEEPVMPMDDQIIDIPKINAQTRHLLTVFISLGLVIGWWMIWKNILPAFSFLERIVLWQHLVVSDNQASYQPVTLTNLVLAGIYFFITVVSVGNFSGVMELLVFSRMTITAGGRYAVNQLARYTLLVIGFVSVSNELGGSWSQVQWLVAALSVGLGFGLQEIFANMVSGIILLFERPIRVGDTVTIDGITGKVARIQMRATTLIDLDQKDLIVPNKTFITNQLINWTLSDPITRVVVPIGIAYGSDVEKAHKVMLDTIAAMPQVLAEPAPSALFIGFGESALTFSIGIYISDLANRMLTIHDLHMRLDKAFREHQIEIPFPQQDIHIRSAASRIDSATGYPEKAQDKHLFP